MTIDPKYSIGIEAMDAEHAIWIQLIEEFRKVGSEHLLEQAGIDAAARALEKLLNYTRTHFASEEAYIAKHNYPALEAHKKQHRELEAAVSKLLSQIRTHNNHSTPLKLNLFMTVWLLEHIMQEDDKYARFILGKAQASSEAKTSPGTGMRETNRTLGRRPSEDPVSR